MLTDSLHLVISHESIVGIQPEAGWPDGVRPQLCEPEATDACQNSCCHLSEQCHTYVRYHLSLHHATCLHDSHNPAI